MLKKIEAIIREDKVNDVREALNDIGIVGMNMFEVRGPGRHSTGRTRRNLSGQHASQNSNQYCFEQTQP
jgi:nitrogen regulatory protein PII